MSVKEITVKNALDEILGKYKYDDNLYKNLLKYNISFITNDIERKSLFSSRLIGCQYIKYTQYDKNLFYNELFNIDYIEVADQVKTITTINKDFKVARDDINLVTLYIAYRFLNNESLDQKKRYKYAEEAIKYLCYRSLIVLVSNFFIYPVSEEKIQTLIEHLSYKYIIKKVKNWKEFCDYRANSFMQSKNLETIKNFNDDEKIVIAINEVFNRIKDTLKNIYSEMLELEEKVNIIKSNSKVVNDIEGEQVILDKLDSLESYIYHIESCLIDKSKFITNEVITVTTNIIKYISFNKLKELLELTYNYYYKDNKNSKEIKDIINKIIIVSLEYLHKNKIFINKNNNIIFVINSIIGTLLYNRNNVVIINELKQDISDLIIKIYKENKIKYHKKYILSIRNCFFIYIIIKALLKI